MKPKILVFLGTRPEALKLAPVIQALKKEPRFELRTILTAQHREMIDQVLRLFKIRVDADLDLMTQNQTLASLSDRLFSRLEGIFKKFRPDLVIVQGDTTTAFIVSLFSFYQRVPIAHVEAGLRSGDKYHPFPEEINRRLISHLADFHFAPTKEAKANLVGEGIRPDRVVVTGNTVIDTLFWIREKLKPSYRRFGKIDFSRRLIFLTAHRRENIGRPLREIAGAARELIRRFPDVEIVYPVHRNPGVQKIVQQSLNGTPRMHLLPPIPYDEAVFLMDRSYLILTDSGGIQEEAPSLGKPVLVLRQVSERPEGVKAGALKVVGTKRDSIVREAARLLNSHTAYSKMAHVRHIYGDGRAATRITRQLKAWLREGA